MTVGEVEPSLELVVRILVVVLIAVCGDRGRGPGVECALPAAGAEQVLGLCGEEEARVKRGGGRMRERGPRRKILRVVGVVQSEEVGVVEDEEVSQEVFLRVIRAR